MPSTAESTSACERLAGVWMDGKHSRLHPVWLQCSDGWLEVFSEAGLLQGRWPLHVVRPSARLAQLPRILLLPDGGRIQVADVPQLARWFPTPPSRVEAFADYLERRRHAVAASAITFVLCLVAFVQVGLPWLAYRAAERVPVAVERHISDGVADLLMRDAGASGLPEARKKILRAQFAALVAGEPRAEQMRLDFIAGKSLGANAFALPDGRMYMTDPLVALADEDAELMAILAHEAGHHVHRHGMRSAIESASIVGLASLLLGDVAGSAVISALPVLLVNNHFSRSHESEADAYAFDLLKRRGYSTEAFASMMEKLMLEERAKNGEASDGGLWDYLSSHPPSQQRVDAARAAKGGRER